MGLRRIVLRLALALLTAAPAVGQDYCQLETSDNFSGYKMRGNRCEGIYAQDVSANLLQIVSFAARFDEFADSNTANLYIRWQAPGDGTLWISGRGQARNSFYGLDTAVPREQEEFSWPAKILQDKGYRKRFLGFLAWYTAEEMQVDKLHLPITVGPGIAPADTSSNSYELVIRTGAAFQQVYLALDRLCGSTYQPVWPDKELGQGYYSTQRVPHRLDVSGSKGVYRLRINALGENGTYAPGRSFHFLHQGNGGPNHCDQ